MSGSLSIVYMGTPAFALPCLEALVAEGYEIPLVVTQPDKPKGRGRKTAPPPIKEAARKHDLEVIQPASIRSEKVINRLAVLSPDLMVVVAYGAILPKTVLDLPRLGAVNIHPSLLPAYRGPAPIQWAVVNGEKETGVTSILMDEGMDSGDIFIQQRVVIGPEETAGELQERLAGIGADVLTQTIRGIAAGTLESVPQNQAGVTYAPPLTKAHGRINWCQPAGRLVDFIRGMTPRPGAYTFCGDSRYRIHRARAVSSEAAVPPGTVLKGFPGELIIRAEEGAVVVISIQGASGKVLNIEDFLRGHGIPEGSVFS